MGFGEKSKPRSAADRVSDMVSERNKVIRRTCADPVRRAKLEGNNTAWLKWYCDNAYFLPMEAPHKAIIDAVQRAHETAGRCVVAGERGIGKSALLYGLTIKFALSGEQPFPVYIPWGKNEKRQGFDFWVDCLVNNERIDADYPEITAPFKHSKGGSQKLMALTWADTGENTHARLQVSQAGVIVFPDGRGYIGSSSMNGNPRGLNATQPGGKIIRPTMALVDDVQDDKTAISQGAAGLVQKTIRKVDGAISGLKRAGATFPILMSGNCICVGDVMDHYLNTAGWDSVRVSCILEWPDAWEKDSGKVHDLWDEFGDKFLAGKGDKSFYKSHKAAMTKGMVMSAPKTYLYGAREAAADKRRKITMPVDAKHAIIREYYRMGHDAFMAERQQKPERAQFSVYALTPELVQSRANKDRPPGIVPEWAQMIVATTDVNPSYALTSAVTAFGPDQVAAVVWYGLYTGAPLPTRKDMSPALQRKIIYEALAAHGKELAALPCRPGMWIIDGGGSPQDTVIDFCRNAPQICGLQAMTAFGRNNRQFRPAAKHRAIPGEQLYRIIDSGEYSQHDERWKISRQWIIFNSDYWREGSQKGWTCSPGAPGSCTLPRGKHQDFAYQVTREQLLGKGEVGGRMIWTWEEKNPHDYGDCMEMAYMGAAMMGIGTGGQRPPPARKRRRPGGVTVVPL